MVKFQKWFKSTRNLGLSLNIHVSDFTLNKISYLINPSLQTLTIDTLYFNSLPVHGSVYTIVCFNWRIKCWNNVLSSSSSIFCTMFGCKFEEFFFRKSFFLMQYFLICIIKIYPEYTNAIVHHT